MKNQNNFIDQLEKVYFDDFDIKQSYLQITNKSKLVLPAINLKEFEDRVEIHMSVKKIKPSQLKFKIEREEMIISSKGILLDENSILKSYSIPPFSLRIKLPKGTIKNKMKSNIWEETLIITFQK